MTNLSVQDTLNYYQNKYQIIKKLENLVIQKGYQMIEPNFLENYDRFSEKHRRINKANMIKLIDNEGVVKVLRPDVTTSIISSLIPKWDNGMTLKVFYNETIFSQTSQGINEQKQFGVEYIGAESETVDLNVIQLVIKLFDAYALPYQVEVSDATILNVLFESVSLETELIDELKRILYQKNQYALKHFVNTYLNDYAYKDFLLMLTRLQGSFKHIQEKLYTVALPETIKNSINRLKVYGDALSNTQLTFDLSMVSEFDYYNGIIFKGYLPSIPTPVLSGGRYDTLSMGYKKAVPAIGFSLALDDLIKEVMN